MAVRNSRSFQQMFAWLLALVDETDDAIRGTVLTWICALSVKKFNMSGRILIFLDLSSCGLSLSLSLCSVFLLLLLFSYICEDRSLGPLITNL